MSGNHDEQTDLCTLSRLVLQDQGRFQHASGDFTLLLVSIQLACKFISSRVRRAGLANLTGLAGEVNVQGEEVKKMDVISNEIMINSLKSSGRVAVMVSEENEELIVVDGFGHAPYSVVFDPLDGSSNIDSGVSIGTIFGIYKAVLSPGRKLVAAGYAMYGSFTAMVLSTGNGVNGYTLDPNLGEFILTNPNMKIPDCGNVYSINEGNSSLWAPQVIEAVKAMKIHPTTGKCLSSRYVGSMAADLHRTLLVGGIFAYPSDKKSPNGKLRLLYECNPMAFIIEQAGGMAIDDQGNNILDKTPTLLHERSSIILGSKDNVAAFKNALTAFTK